MRMEIENTNKEGKSMGEELRKVDGDKLKEKM